MSGEYKKRGRRSSRYDRTGPRRTTRNRLPEFADKAVKRRERKVEQRNVDFSKKAINREVTRESFRKPYVYYPMVAGAIAAVTAVITGGATAAAVAATGLLIGAAGWVYNMTLGRQKHVSEYLKSMNEILANKTQDSIADLRDELKAGLEPQGLKQQELVENKYAAFNKVLETKFNKNEITYGRYHAMVEQVFLAVLDNLKQITHIRKTINAIDEEHVVRRIRQLERERQTTAVRRELDALVSRYHLLQNQRELVQEKLAQNEAAMTKMDEVMAAVSAINPAQSHASLDMEQAMEELADLANKAGRYSSK